jgi:hypothetical protein
VRLAGTPNVYVTPGSGPAFVMRYDSERKSFIPIGQLPPFSAVQALRVLREPGLAEIRLTDNEDAYMEAARLVPGNLRAAHQAYCAYNAGPPPVNGEILARSGSGPGRTTIENESGQPMVVKLRERNGATAAAVFLQPGGDTTVDGLPDGAYRPDYAIGEMWSRACNSFAAGMRAQRFAEYTDLASLGKLAIPPDFPDRPPPVDIPDQDFEQE